MVKFGLNVIIDTSGQRGRLNIPNSKWIYSAFFFYKSQDIRGTVSISHNFYTIPL